MNLKVEYLGDIEVIFEMALDNESGDQVGLIHEKNQRPKISWDYPFNEQDIVQIQIVITGSADSPRFSFRKFSLIMEEHAVLVPQPRRRFSGALFFHPGIPAEV
jgi:hypothetical protein